MGFGKYILIMDRPIEEPDVLKWGRWMESSRRTIAREKIGDSEVNTVFLGLDHGFGKGPPVLWETMVFGGRLDQEQDRCSGTIEDAKRMHARMARRVADIVPPIRRKRTKVQVAKTTKPRRKFDFSKEEKHG